jgi:hypothetical protein
MTPSTDMTSSADAMQLQNAASDHRGHRSPSKMIQDFENLFHQELMDTADADKVYTAWKELKHAVLMRILNATTRQLEATQQPTRRDPPISYVEVMRRGLNTTEKPVPKQLDHEITILRRKCPSLDGEEAKPAKIVEAVNTKLGAEAKGKVVAARKLPSGDIVLITDSADAKDLLLKETS